MLCNVSIYLLFKTEPEVLDATHLLWMNEPEMPRHRSGQAYLAMLKLLLLCQNGLS